MTSISKKNSKPYQRKGYLNFFELPTKEEHKKQNHEERLKKWKERNGKNK